MEVGERDWRQENRLMVLLLIQIKVENKAVRTGLERDRSFLKMKQKKNGSSGRFSSFKCILEYEWNHIHGLSN